MDRATMTVYRYGLRYRPLSLGAQPKGFIPNPLLFQREINYKNRYRWGYVDYPFMLSADDLKAYEIEYVGEREQGTPELNPEPA
jgi:hypothetical protein